MSAAVAPSLDELQAVLDALPDHEAMGAWVEEARRAEEEARGRHGKHRREHIRLLQRRQVQKDVLNLRYYLRKCLESERRWAARARPGGDS